MSNIDKQARDMEREYFILSTAHTQRGDPYITLWAADDSGYRCRCHTAGRYAESHVLSNLGYYNNGVQTVAVPCDAAEPLSHSVAKGFFDDNDGRWLRNNAATWKELLKHAIAAPKHVPAPEYRGAPRKVEG
ncbi:TPA: hypothetical protein LSH87_003758 [Citrobacter koseri]|uniref:hypothetical protein n=1 Tax=Citrobacter koseri TaxID=545 RepID=UPI0023B126CE|nr:hypothetical protein [Citrobacter koseri]HBL6925849.1 hypothetical protein [Citrobacter koseri]HBL6930752.1 hypothetical protein [Citrobacter koseri]